MHEEIICNRIRADIEQLLTGMRTPGKGAAFSAARATRDISDALHHASGRPHDVRWFAAMSSLESFLSLCGSSWRLRNDSAFAELSAFLEENADLLGARASYIA